MCCQSICHFVRYFNDAEEPDVTPRIIEFFINDGKFNSSVNVTIDILSLNDNRPMVSMIVCYYCYLLYVFLCYRSMYLPSLTLQKGVGHYISSIIHWSFMTLTPLIGQLSLKHLMCLCALFKYVHCSLCSVVYIQSFTVYLTDGAHNESLMATIDMVSCISVIIKT